MFQKDYILRMIEMIGDLIAVIIGLLKKGDPDQAEKILERSYYEFLRKDASFFQLIPKDLLTNQLLSDHNYTNGHLAVLAELFYAEAMVNEAQNRPTNSKQYYEKALVLLEFLEQEDKTWSAKREERMNLIKEKISLT
ncbi:MAG: hypothetical protein WCP85_16945 [Mariniphaga sp.]